MSRLVPLLLLAAPVFADWREIRAGQVTVLTEEGKNERAWPPTIWISSDGRWASTWARQNRS